MIKQKCIEILIRNAMHCGETQFYQAMWYQSIAGNINFQKAMKNHVAGMITLICI